MLHIKFQSTHPRSPSLNLKKVKTEWPESLKSPLESLSEKAKPKRKSELPTDVVLYLTFQFTIFFFIDNFFILNIEIINYRFITYSIIKLSYKKCKGRNKASLSTTLNGLNFLNNNFSTINFIRAKPSLIQYLLLIWILKILASSIKCFNLTFFNIKASFSDSMSVQIKPAENSLTLYKIFSNKNLSKNKQEEAAFVRYDSNFIISFSMR